MPRNFRPVIYLGFNDPRNHVRGTENVIRAQSEAAGGRNYYVFRAPRFAIFRWQGLIAIACPDNIFLALLFVRKLVQRLRKRAGVQPIIHGHSYLLAMVASGAPQIFTVHDGLTYLKKSFGSRLLWPYKIIELWVYWRSAKIHAISRYTWSQVCGADFFGQKLTVIYNSLPSPARKLDEPQAPAKTSPIEYLIVRSIEPRANLDLVVALARHCQLTDTRVSIVVAGKGPLLAHFRKIQSVEQLDNLRFTGYVSDATLDALYRRSDCVIMPALYGEGFGLPLIEAYSRGIPAVGSGVCAVPEVIFSPQLMFENSLPSMLAAIQEAARIPRPAFVGYFNANFSRPKIAQQYRALYESVR